MEIADNISLIGMPGAGKSTLGVLLAKQLCCPFIDTDLLIQSRSGRRLTEIIRDQGLEYFLALEQGFISELACRRTVIATGGSVVYSEPAMLHLKAGGRVVWIDVPLPILEQRLGDLRERGVVMASGQSLAELYAERQPLYARYADLTLRCGGLTHDRAVTLLLKALRPSCVSSP